MRFRFPEAVVEGHEELGALFGGNDVASAPVGGGGATQDEARRFEVIQEVGHDRAVDAEVLGQGELTVDVAVCGGGEDLVAPWTTGKVGQRGVRGRDIGPEDHAQAPSEIFRECLVAAANVRLLRWVVRGSMHPIILAFLSPDRRRHRCSVRMMLCSQDDLGDIRFWL